MQHEELGQVLTKVISSSLALSGDVMIVVPCPPPVVPVHDGRLNCQTTADLSQVLICDSAKGRCKACHMGNGNFLLGCFSASKSSRTPFSLLSAR